MKQVVLHGYGVPPMPHSSDYRPRSLPGLGYHMLYRAGAQPARWPRRVLPRVHARVSLFRVKRRAHHGPRGRPSGNPRVKLA